MKLLFKIFFTLSISFHTNASAQKDTLRVLFVGNSYTYYSDLPKMVSELSKSTSTYIKTEMSAIGGARLKHHYTEQHNLKTKNLIKNGKFDVVVLQEQSMGTLTNKKEFHEYSKKLSNHIKEHGAEPFFFTTWSRERTPQTQKKITKAYNEVALQNNGVAVLVGEAWKLAKKVEPTINIYNKDGSHPTLLGTFLTAVVFVKTLTGEMPSKSKNIRTTNISSTNLQLCMQIVRLMSEK